MPKKKKCIPEGNNENEDLIEIISHVEGFQNLEKRIYTTVCLPKNVVCLTSTYFYRDV